MFLFGRGHSARVVKGELLNLENGRTGSRVVGRSRSGRDLGPAARPPGASSPPPVRDRD